MKGITMLVAGAVSGALLLTSNAALARMVQVTVTNNAPVGGTYLTPVWAGFHDGSFDSFDTGSAASAAIEAVAEDGNTAPISAAFAGTPNAVQDTVGGAPIAPGGSVTQTFNVSNGGMNTYFSYASMVLSSSDYFVGNGNPLAHSIADILNGIASSVSFTVGTVYDAGTEVNDFATSAGNGLFAGLGGGQTGPGEGAAQGGVVTAVAGTAYADYLNVPPGFDLSQLDFNNSQLYANGLATITISAVPVPAALPLLAGALGLLGFARRRLG